MEGSYPLDIEPIISTLAPISSGIVLILLGLGPGPEPRTACRIEPILRMLGSRVGIRSVCGNLVRL